MRMVIKMPVWTFCHYFCWKSVTLCVFSISQKQLCAAIQIGTVPQRLYVLYLLSLGFLVPYWTASPGWPMSSISRVASPFWSANRLCVGALMEFWLRSSGCHCGESLFLHYKGIFIRYSTQFSLGQDRQALFLNRLQNLLTFSVSFANKNRFSGFQLETGVESGVQTFG